MAKRKIARRRAVPKAPPQFGDVLELNRKIWDQADTIKNLNWAIGDLEKGTLGHLDKLDTTRALLAALPPHLALLTAAARKLTRLLDYDLAVRRA